MSVLLWSNFEGVVHAECQGHIAVPALPVSGQFTLPVPLELYLGVTEMWQKRSAECVSEAVTQGGPRRSLSATGPASVLSVSYLYDDYGINDNDYGKMIIICTCIWWWLSSRFSPAIFLSHHYRRGVLKNGYFTVCWSADLEGGVGDVGSAPSALNVSKCENFDPLKRT